MLEAGGALKTWALSQEPAERIEIAAEVLADHRLAYLEYEGPVSGGRGTVARWDRENEWIVDLSGERLSGRVTLVRLPAGANAWSWRFTAAPRR
jgi:hypothetical protein